MEVLTIIAIIISPVAAVLITLWYQNREKQRELKYNTFLTLIKYRELYPPSIEFISALNTIDFVFYKHPKVVQIWHEYFAIVSHAEPVNVETLNRKKLDLLSEMGKALGYRDVKQTSIDEFYVARGHVAEREELASIKRELLIYLQSLNILLQQSPPTTAPTTPIPPQVNNP